MGVDFSKERPPLAIACVTEILQLDLAQFATLRKLLQSPQEHHSVPTDSTDQADEQPANPEQESDTHSHGTGSAWRAKDLTLEAFESALVTSEIAPNDREILNRMFILMDRTGDELIHSLELLIAAALLVKGTFEAKLELAIATLIADLHETPLTTMHLVFLLSTMTTTANYFGDQLLPLPVLEGIADDAYQELKAAEDLGTASSPINMSALLVQAMVKHPVVQDYVSQETQSWSPR